MVLSAGTRRGRGVMPKQRGSPKHRDLSHPYPAHLQILLLFLTKPPARRAGCAAGLEH